MGNAEIPLNKPLIDFPSIEPSRMRGTWWWGTLFCDECGFDPQPELSGIAARSRLDVHHKHPLAEEGVRPHDAQGFRAALPHLPSARTSTAEGGKTRGSGSPDGETV